MERRHSTPDGLRERKRRETRDRIAEAGLNLFIKNGYEATTLDAIAEVSGISRRTFFYYFKSKEDILLAWQQGLPDAVRAAVLAESSDQRPIHAVRNALLSLAAQLNSKQAVVIDRILRSNEQLKASNQAKFLLMERAAFEALCELWPQARRRRALQIVAMVAIGTLRIAIDTWSDDGGRKSVEKCLKEAFAALEAEF